MSSLYWKRFSSPGLLGWVLFGFVLFLFFCASSFPGFLSSSDHILQRESISYDLLSWIFFFFLFVKFALRVRCHIKSTLFSHGVLYNRCGWGLWLGY
ncbi:cyclin D2, isoform CRA_c [Rattus norvegicus]|uniref:Cyclin D2, isoform CRA_c n=1 Tax=Rattus norvegicus TaxID=10116 RepID=A6ILX4_RAT|nr:cyclin D2, isoform CRA_c [Rattus norvegicus]